MPDPGDTKAGDRGQGAGWSKTSPSTKPSGGGGSGPRGPESSWGTRGSPTGGSLTGGQLSGHNGGGGKTNTPTGPRGPQSSWGTRGSPTGGKLTGGQLSRYGGGGSPGGALSAGLGGNYTNRTISNPISLSSSMSDGLYSRLSPNSLSLPGMESPTQFDNRIYQTNFVNTYGNPMETWSNGYDPNRLTPGAQKIHQAVIDNAFRTGTPVDYFSGKRAYNPKTGTTQHSLGQALDIRINDPVTGLPVGYDQIGEAAYNPIGSVRPGYRTDAEAARIQDALEKPYQDFAQGVLGGFYNNPDVYGPFANQRWGGAFETGVFSKDYMHFDQGKAATGVSRSQADLREMAQNTPAPQGPLSAPDVTAPLRVAQAGMSGGLFSATAAPQQPTAPDAPIGPVLDAPYSNLFDKEDRLDVAENFVPSWMQSDYTGPPRAVAEANVPSWRQSSYTGRENVVPSYAQSTYTGPIDTVMNTPDPITPAASPSEPDIPFPVSTDSLGYKVWRGLTRVGDSLFPGSGMMLRAMDDDLRERWPSMTNEERQALIDKWERQNRPSMSNASYVTGGSYEPKRGGDGPIVRPMIRPEEPSKNKAPKKEAEDASWKQDALAYGFTEAQLKDPEIAAYIKQLWDMGWIPNSA